MASKRGIKRRQRKQEQRSCTSKRTYVGKKAAMKVLRWGLAHGLYDWLHHVYRCPVCGKCHIGRRMF